ncbi:MAG: metallophosphoesterase [Kiritimatiellae bacterium]|nr:metallophosphoesterase [Kiritimatiellia bacterium]
MRIKSLSLLVSLAVLAAISSAPAAENPPAATYADWAIGPYLQSPTPTAMTICFVSDHAADVSIRVKPGAQNAWISHPAIGTLIPNTAATVWKCRLKNLAPNTAYEYSLDHTANNTKVTGKTYTFKTPSLNNTETRWIVLNDVHNRMATVDALMEHVSPHDYEFSILLGDCWNDPTWGKSGETIMKTLESFIRNLHGHEKPILYVRGNHEWRGYFADKHGYLFDLPNLDPTASRYEQNYYFSFAAGPVRFLFADCGEDGNKREELFQPYRQRQTQWLADEIKKPEYASGKYRIFASHIPLFNENQWHAGRCRELWSSTLAQANLDLALAAHDHQWRVLKKNCACVNKKCEHCGQSGVCPHSPPYPLVIGGGPSLKEGTVMLLQADSANLSMRMQNCAGTVIAEFAGMARE